LRISGGSLCGQRRCPSVGHDAPAATARPVQLRQHASRVQLLGQALPFLPGCLAQARRARRDLGLGLQLAPSGRLPGFPVIIFSTVGLGFRMDQLQVLIRSKGPVSRRPQKRLDPPIFVSRRREDRCPGGLGLGGPELSRYPPQPLGEAQPQRCRASWLLRLRQGRRTAAENQRGRGPSIATSCPPSSLFPALAAGVQRSWRMSSRIAARSGLISRSCTGVQERHAARGWAGVVGDASLHDLALLR
jgi:hypothetical protein